MKTLMFTFAFTAALFATKAQTNDRFQTAMQAALGNLYKSYGTMKIEDFQATANQFERIGAVETKEWLPNYWASYCYVFVASLPSTPQGDKDKLVDKAESFLTKAISLTPDNDELQVMTAYIAQTRLAIDPMNRWQTALPVQQAALAKAKEMNAENPRISMLEGVGLYYTPEQFGGGAKVACPILKNSVEKYAKFKPASAIHPNWGEAFVKQLAGKCE